MIRHFFTRQFARFVLAGGLAALANWIARLMLSAWVPFGIAIILAYGVGMLVAFVLNSIFVFPHSTKSRSAQARDFIVINLFSFPLVWGSAIALNHGLIALGLVRHSQELAHAIAIALPVLAVFLLYKFIAFKERGDELGDRAASAPDPGIR